MQKRKTSHVNVIDNDIRYSNQDEKNDASALPALTHQLLTFVAAEEGKTVIHIFDEINDRKQPGVDIVSATLIFLVVYLSCSLKA